MRLWQDTENVNGLTGALPALLAADATGLAVSAGITAPLTLSGTTLSISLGSGLSVSGGALVSDGKVFVDANDTTRDFLAAKVVGSPRVSVTVAVAAPPTTNLVQWFEAGNGLNIGAGTWTDLSGNGNNCTSVTGTPVLNPSSLNGQPGVTFNGSNFFSGTTNPLPSGATREVVFVVKPSTTGLGLFASWRRSGPAWIADGRSSGGNSTVWDDGVANADLAIGLTYAASTGYVLDYQSTVGGKVALSVNGVAQTITGGNVSSDTGSSGFTIGCYYGGSLGLVGDLLAVFVYSATLTTSQRNTLFAYLQQRWGVALGATPSGDEELIIDLVGGAPVASVSALAPLFSTGGTTPVLSLHGGIVSGSSSTTAQNLGSLTSGVLQQTVTSGTATLSALSGTLGSIPFFTSGGQLTQDNANFFWDASNHRIGVGTNTPGYALDIIGASTGVVGFHLKNSTSGTAAQVQNVVENSTGVVGYFGVTSAAFTGLAPINGGHPFFGGFGADVSIFTQDAHALTFWTNGTLALTVTSTQAIQAASLAAGGIVKAAATTGQLGIAVAGTDYAPAGNYITALTTDVVATGPGSVAATIQPNVVTYAKIQQVSALHLLGNAGLSTANVAEIGLVSPLGFSGGNKLQLAYDTVSLTLNGSFALQRGALTGDVTATAGSNATTIAANAVTYGKIQQASAGVLIGNPTASTANVSEITIGTGLSLSVGGVLSATGSSGITQLTGDVTAGPGSGSQIATLANIPSGVPAAGDINVTPIAAPATPGTGHALVYVDSTSLNLTVKSSLGAVNHGVQTVAPISHLFVTGTHDDGTLATAQPAFTDLTGTISAAQLGSFTNGSVLYWNSGLAQDNSHLFYDSTNHTLVLGGGTAASGQSINATGNAWLSYSNATAFASGGPALLQLDNTNAGTGQTNIVWSHGGGAHVDAAIAEAIGIIYLYAPGSQGLQVLNSIDNSKPLAAFAGTGLYLYGGVGSIGTTTSSAPLEIGGATSGTAILLSQSATQNITKSNGALGILTNSAQPINLATNSTVALTITSGQAIQAASLSAGGIVNAAASTGQLGLATVSSPLTYSGGVLTLQSGIVLITSSSLHFAFSGGTAGTTGYLIQYDSTNLSTTFKEYPMSSSTSNVEMRVNLATALTGTASITLQITRDGGINVGSAIVLNSSSATGNYSTGTVASAGSNYGILVTCGVGGTGTSITVGLSTWNTT